MKKPELLAPVSNWPSLRAAIESKADAIYFGVKQLNMRITAKNFELSELKKVVDECRKNKVRSYLTLNTIVYDNEVLKLKQILKQAKKAKVDAIIAFDFAVISEASKLKLPIHLSTQASVSNFESLKAICKKFNINNIILARELGLNQIKEIIKKIKENRLDIKIETFIHGAMCVSISGRCFISQFQFNRSANRGDCLQPCRRSYIVKYPEENYELNLENNYVMSPKDLCTLPFIEKLIDSGISSFKIEGRNRSPEYVKVVTECYRDAIDAYAEHRLDSQLKKQLIKKLKTVYNRGFSSGFYLGKPINEWTDQYGSKATKTKHYIGKVKNYYKKIKVAEIKIETKDLNINDEIMFQGSKTGVFSQKLTSMQFDHTQIKKAKKQQRIAVKVNKVVRVNDKVFLID